MAGILGPLKSELLLCFTDNIYMSPIRSGFSDTQLTQTSTNDSLNEEPSNAGSPEQDDDDDDDDEFVYPGAPAIQTEGVLPVASPARPQPSPAQLESLYAAATSGDLPLLKRLFRNALDTSDVEPFSLANDASSRIGFTTLHAAASRGYLDIVTWCTLAIKLDQDVV